MPHVNIWVRKNDWDKWQLVDNKSQLVSQAINRSEITPVVRKSGIRLKQEIPKEVLAIPGVEKASKARCKGTHYMNRHDCGKPLCLWAGQ